MSPLLDFCMLKAFVEVKLHEARQAPSLTSSPSITLDSQESCYVSAWKYRGWSPSVLKKPTFCPTALSLPLSLLCHGYKRLSNAFVSRPGQKAFTLGTCFKVTLSHKGCPNCRSFSPSCCHHFLFFVWRSKDWQRILKDVCISATCEGISDVCLLWDTREGCLRKDACRRAMFDAQRSERDLARQKENAERVE